MQPLRRLKRRRTSIAFVAQYNAIRFYLAADKRLSGGGRANSGSVDLYRRSYLVTPINGLRRPSKQAAL